MKLQLEKLTLASSLVDRSNQIKRISQEAWYLNIVSKYNYILKTHDCSFILPGISSLTINKVFIPPFVQRIDPFVTSDKNFPVVLPNELFNNFPCGLLSFSNKIQNPPDQITESIRINYYLNLEKPYEELFKKYNNGHKLNLKQASRQNIKVNTTQDIQGFVEHYLKHSHTDIPGNYKNKEMITKLITECLNRNSGTIYKAENQNKEILAYSFITKYELRLVYLFSSSSTEGKKQYAMYAIIDEIIRTHCNSNLILDFEGSMIPGIAYFMKGFGADEENYFLYEWNEHWICKLKKYIKKLI